MLPGEIQILQWLESLRTPFWNRFWEAITFFGEDMVLIVLIALLYFMVNKKEAYRICFLTVTSLGLNGILKNLVRLPRPFSGGRVNCVRPETATGYSFPSGHTQNFTTWVTAFALRQKKWWLWSIAILSSLLMGISRMFLGAHYFSDVAAAWILGILVSSLGSYCYEKATDPNGLYLAVFAGFTPFFFFFLWRAEPLFSDFFKCYGLLGGFLPAVRLENRYGNLSLSVPFWKKLLRMLVGILLALVLKQSLKALWTPLSLRMCLLWDTFRYFVLVLLIFGGYPVLLKRMNW